jgi:hypothetical protein
MRDWRELHPYNAVHVVRVEGTADLSALERAISAELCARRLGEITISARGDGYSYSDVAPRPHITVVDSVTDAYADAALAQEVERQLNLAFPPIARYQPFRFFVVAAPASFRLGVAYDHFVAAGDAVLQLLAAIASRFAGCGGVSGEPIDRYPPTYRHWFLRRPMLLLRALWRLPGLLRDAGRALRPRYRPVEDAYAAYDHLRLAPHQVRAMRALATRWDVTLHDLLLAILLRAVAPFAASWQRGDSRRPIAIGSILNIRSSLGPAGHATLSPFLASRRVEHADPLSVPLETLARDVHREASRARRDELHWAAALAPGLSSLFWRLLTARQRRRLFLARYPLCGALSLLDIDASWPSAAVPASSYQRGAPAGPLAPVVLAASIAGGAMSVGITYRRSALPPTIVDALERELHACLMPRRPARSGDGADQPQPSRLEMISFMISDEPAPIVMRRASRNARLMGNSSE